MTASVPRCCTNDFSLTSAAGPYMTNSIRALTVHLVRGMVGIRVYVHHAILLYPDYTPFKRKV